MARTSRRVHRRTSRPLKPNAHEHVRLRFRVEDPDESERFEQEDFDEEEAREEETRRRMVMELPTEQPRFRPNVRPSVPKPSGADEDDILAWAQVTYADGTPVMFLRWPPGQMGFLRHDSDPDFDRDRVLVPIGARGEIVRFSGGGSSPFFVVRIVDARSDATGERMDIVGEDVIVRAISAAAFIEPMIDNWVHRRSYRTVAPHRVTRGVYRTSRRVSPNSMWDGWTESRTRSGHVVYRRRR